jgi:hypothetical protein
VKKDPRAGRELRPLEARRRPEGAGRALLGEPDGPLHIAHGRQAAVGDSLANLLDFAGFQVAREFYINDTGNQIEMLGKSIQWRMGGDPNPPDENAYRGEYIKTIADEIKAQGARSRPTRSSASARTGCSRRSRRTSRCSGPLRHVVQRGVAPQERQGRRGPELLQQLGPDLHEGRARPT